MQRREFIQRSTIAAGTLMLPGLVAKCSSKQDNKLGIALVGLGKYSTEQLAPALQQTDNCFLAGIVSGTESKRNSWSDKYDIPSSNIYSYDTFDQIKDNKDIGIVYVVLPNSLHKEYVVRAAQAGKHVICEKPMGISSEECQEMIEACKKHGVKLFMGYRLHFDPYHQYLIGMRAESRIRSVIADFGYVIRDYSEWRMKKSQAGGGALMNVGIYCLQSACYILAETPTSVTAQAFTTDPKNFNEVEETIAFQLHFPSGVTTNFTTSHNMNMNRLQVDTEKELFSLSPAFSYGESIGNSYESKSFRHVNQQALQMDHFAACVISNKESQLNGEMGLRDIRIIESIYESVDIGRAVPVTSS